MHLLVLLFFSAFMCGCHSAQKVTVRKSWEQESAVRAAIADFSTIRKLYKKDTVFSVSLYKVPHKDELIVVQIMRCHFKLLLTPKVKVGVKGVFPSRYMEKEGKLFFWDDDSVALSSETLSVFERNNLLQDDDNGRRRIPSFTTDESEKGVHYYFCKNDLSAFIRVITNIGFGYYKFPVLVCGKE